MAEYKQVGTGTMGRNKWKKSDVHPDYTGSITFEGRKINISVWRKQDIETPDHHYYTFVLSEKADGTDNIDTVNAKLNAGVDNDDIPF